MTLHKLVLKAEHYSFADWLQLVQDVGQSTQAGVLPLRVGAKELSTAKVHGRVRTGAIGVVGSLYDGLIDVVLIDVVHPNDLGYHVDAQQAMT